MQSSRRNSLGTLLEASFEERGSADDLTAAIKLIEGSLGLTGLG